jgi:DNA-binding SARP family transcriptional activator
VAELVEVRVLGGFEVRDGSGELVGPTAWRTSKTRDLVRLLAMSAGQVVPADVLVDALWPDVDPDRGRASLRTAASQVRQVLGADHLVRRTGGLVLTAVWVDALAFEALASTAVHALAAGELAEGVTTAWDALTLYTGDLCTDEPGSAGTAGDREHYRRLLQRLLVEAADGACRLGWLRDAAELGHRALALDPCAEAAYRVLMRTYSKLGETGQALGLYESCRAALAEAFGADPGPETRALHAELLQPVRAGAPEPPFVGRVRCLDEVRAALPGVLEEHRPALFVVAGVPGSGRTRFVHEVVRTWPHEVVEVRGSVPHDLPALDDGVPVLLVAEDLSPADTCALGALTALLRERTPLLALVTAAAPDGAGPHPLLAVDACRLLVLPPLSADEVAQLLRPVLGAAPAGSLVDELHAFSGGRPSAVLETARRLMSTGQLLSTSDGLVRAPWHPSRVPAEQSARLLRVRQSTAPHGGSAIDVLAVLDRPASAAELSRLTGVPGPELAQALGQLCDLGVVATGRDGYRLRGAVVRELAYRWLRPTVRRALHRRVAEGAALPSAARIEHWVAGGEPALACAAALLAADEALLAGDDERARAHLLRVLAFAGDHAEDAADVVGLHERLAVVEERLGRVSEARASLEAAIALARSGPPAVVAQLHRRLARLASTEREALHWYAQAAQLPGLDGRERSRIALDVAATTAVRSPDAALAVLRDAVAQADDTDDLQAQAQARVLLAAAAARCRAFGEAYAVGKAAVTLAELTGDPLLRVRAVHALAQTPAYLGGAQRERDLLLRLREQAVALGDARVVCDVSLTSCLVLHDLGDPQLDQLWPAVAGLAGATRRGRVRLLLDALVSLERDQPRRTERLLQELVGSPGDPLVDAAAQLVLGRLRAAVGDVDGAVAVLTPLVAASPGTGSTLLLPEAAAHLALLQAPTDAPAAERTLALAVEAAGDRSYPRERVSVLRARAALLAATGDPQAAATMALASALSARRAGLVHQERQSQRLRAALLEQAPRSPQPRAPLARPDREGV